MDYLFNELQPTIEESDIASDLAIEFLSKCGYTAESANSIQDFVVLGIIIGRRNAEWIAQSEGSIHS